LLLYESDLNSLNLSGELEISYPNICILGTGADAGKRGTRRPCLKCVF